jgi:hypothetical protein
LQSIHDRVTAPYDYTQGYHFLMKHLPTRYVPLPTHHKCEGGPWDSSSDQRLGSLFLFPRHFAPRVLSLFFGMTFQIREERHSSHCPGISHLPTVADCPPNALVVRRWDIRGKVFPAIPASKHLA